METDILFRSFSIKYVLEGCENYNINHTNYKVNSGEYLLANNYSGGKLFIESANPVKGICIDIAPDIIENVCIGLNFLDTIENEKDTKNFFLSDLYPENKYKIEKNFLSKKLIQISKIIENNPNYNFEFSNEFYYEIAESIVLEQHLYYNHILNVKALKSQTKKELFKKLLNAKEYIENNYLVIQNIEEIAIISTISEYHFFRLFKQVFKISPYQYLNQLKLNKALELLKKSNKNYLKLLL